MKKCYSCWGTGDILHELGDGDYDAEPCENCGGTGFTGPWVEHAEVQS